MLNFNVSFSDLIGFFYRKRKIKFSSADKWIINNLNHGECYRFYVANNLYCDIEKIILMQSPPTPNSDPTRYKLKAGWVRGQDSYCLSIDDIEKKINNSR